MKPLTIVQISEYESGSCGLLMSIWWGLFPGLFQKRIDRKFKRYIEFINLKNSYGAGHSL